eukprot:CAMPEP_0202114092 /NCGR_PEP_ID=MMETSP0965-20130614/35437_1 /ASSEMBLY_ACC=CAM_ASM_000507 /TAXON_ID=4773 /ORGANISM="Schizochytrium aggregatum, Strain ATCC28209" /LENGTH=59 /DNA_ID=CAMNT_0048683773 /DNA_START=164 /DNA_END=340 /DNA_ORIENTATION=+
MARRPTRGSFALAVKRPDHVAPAAERSSRAFIASSLDRSLAILGRFSRNAPPPAQCHTQ